jgi:ABC-type branched-subunit amino acid transport system substrate-binding protein
MTNHNIAHRTQGITALVIRVVIGGFLCLIIAGRHTCAAAVGEWREVFVRDPAANRTFQQGLDDYQNGDYGQAERKFRSLFPAPIAADEEVVALYVAKCLLAQKLYHETETWLAECRDKYPGGLYEDALIYLSGHAAYYTGDPGRAAAYYLQACKISRDAGLRRLAAACLSPLFAHWLSDAQLWGLADEIPEGPVAAEYYFHNARRHEARGRMAQAEQNYREVLRHGKDNPRYQEAEELLAQLRRRSKPTTRIGLLYPATGPLAEFGTSMYNAARLAGQTRRDSPGGQIEIVAEDTGGEPLGASLAAQRLAEEDIAAVVGPLTSESAVAAASVAACTGIIQILPAASKEGLTSLSTRLFQMTSTPATVGAILATYAVDMRHDSTLAVIAPDDDYGREISRAFQKTAVQKGAIVFPVLCTQPGQTDHRNELMRLKRTILRELYDSTRYIAETGDSLTEEQIPVHIGSILLPGDAAELNTLLPQLRFYNINAGYLGTDGWAHTDLLSRSRAYLEGAVFASPEYHDPENRRWLELSTDWKRTYGGEPDIVAARTYDAVIIAAKLLTEQPSRSATTAVFDGVSGAIEFSNTGENIRVPLYRYDHGRIRPVKDVPLVMPEANAPED